MSLSAFTWREWGREPLPPSPHFLVTVEWGALFTSTLLTMTLHLSTDAKPWGLSSWPDMESSGNAEPKYSLEVIFSPTHCHCDRKPPLRMNVRVALKKGVLQRVPAAVSRRACPQSGKASMQFGLRTSPWISSFFSHAVEGRAAATDAQWTTEDMNTHDEHQGSSASGSQRGSRLSVCLSAFYPLFSTQTKGPQKGN